MRGRRWIEHDQHGRGTFADSADGLRLEPVHKHHDDEHQHDRCLDFHDRSRDHYRYGVGDGRGDPLGRNRRHNDRRHDGREPFRGREPGDPTDSPVFLDRLRWGRAGHREVTGAAPTHAPPDATHGAGSAGSTTAP